MTQIVLPKWMDNEFFEKVLRTSERDQSIKVSNYELVPASSTIFHAKIKYSQKLKNDCEISIIIKTKEFLEVETKMYLEILPEVQKLLSLIYDKSFLNPKIIYSANKPSATILVFEDICTNGFFNSDKLGLNFELTKAAVNRLGQYHAASMVMDYNKQGIKEYNQGIFQKNDSYTKNIQNFIDALKTWQGYEIYVEKFEKVLKNFGDLMKQHTSPNTIGEGYNVLNHGDFCTKNIMFRNIENPNETEIMLMDYQIGFYGSPAYDVYYSVYGMGDMDVREHHFDEIVSHYYSSFSKSLQSMGYMGKTPTLIDLHEELLRHGFIEVVLNLWFTPLMYQVADHSQIFSNPDLIKYFQKKLPKFLTKGFLD